MNKQLQLFKLLLLLLSIGFAGAFFASCDDDEKPKTVPNVTTGTVTEITGTSAIVSGDILDDGNTTGIISSGFVYSSTNAEPTLADNKTEETATDGEYTSELEGLNSSTTYHVRAYAINSVGTGFGEVVDFITGNAAPVASDVEITGTIEANAKVTASYTYSDSENDVQSGTTFQWHKANDGAKTGAAPIAGATSATYTIQDADHGKYIWVVVTPKAATGTTTGIAVESALEGPVGEATTVTFMYKTKVGADIVDVEVTYGIINSAKTGRRWMDRNLGAPNTPTAETDWANYGDLFQWGRAADGHQLLIRGATTDETIMVNVATTVLATTNTPVDSKFIRKSGFPGDWRNPQNDDLWQSPNQINNPCPSGWHIPTAAEWIAEDLGTGTMEEAFGKLKITLGGLRSYASGNVSDVNDRGIYWSSTVEGGGEIGAISFNFWAGLDSHPQEPALRASGLLCRCIKNE